MDFASKLVIPASVEAKIRYLCGRFPHNEWSGYLFTTHTGKLEDNNLVVTAKDILLMGLGTSTATEFDDGPDVASYIAKHHDLLSCKRMHIHSHNSMQAFHSGVDLEDMRVQGNNNINMISLVVNNAGNYVAAMTRKVHSVRQVHDCWSYENLDNDNIQNCSDYTETDDVIEWFLMTVDVDKTTQFSSLEDRIKELETPKAIEKLAPAVNPATSDKTIYLDSSAIDKFSSDFDWDAFEEEEKSGSLWKWNKWKYLPDDESLHTHALTKEQEKMVDLFILRLLTGNVFTNSLDNINLSTWCSKVLPKMVKSRFKEADLNEWIEVYVEYLLQETISFDLNEETRNIIICAITNKLHDLPSNVYTDKAVEYIEKYYL